MNRSRYRDLVGVALVAVALSVGLQSRVGAQPAGAPPGAATASAPLASPAAALSFAEARRDEWRKARTSLYMNDFGELNRYRRANAQLKPVTAGEQRVVFFGDSITDAWRLNIQFPGRGYLNRGIGGQTTAQMLVRFRQDVIELAPKAVVILAGTNDIAGNTGPMTLADTEANYTSMAELARLHGIRVVFSSILPVHHYTPRSDLTFPLRAPETIAELNRWLRTYCAANGHVYLDYATAVTDQKGWLKRDLAEDGLHPNAAGYALMGALAEGALSRAVAGDRPPGGSTDRH
jgi:lysophospholipase L1-like esterase